MVVDIFSRNDRGFDQYGEPVRTDRGMSVEVYESSAAGMPHCWLRIFDDVPEYRAAMSAHLTVAQAMAVRDRLSAFIEQQQGTVA